MPETAVTASEKRLLHHTDRANRSEDLACDLEMFVAGVGAGGDTGHALADEGRGVGHCPHNRDGSQTLLIGGSGDPGGKGDHRVLRSYLPGESFEEGRDICGLDRDHYRLAPIEGRDRVGNHHTAGRRQLLDPLLAPRRTVRSHPEAIRLGASPAISASPMAPTPMMATDARPDIGESI